MNLLQDANWAGPFTFDPAVLAACFPALRQSARATLHQGASVWRLMDQPPASVPMHWDIIPPFRIAWELRACARAKLAIASGP